MTRRESREKALCYLFELAAQPELSPESIVQTATEEREEQTSRFATEVFYTAAAHLPEIDEAIAQASENWSFSRIGKVSLAVLRLAVCELRFLPEPTPKEIAVNEALELARTYDTDAAVPFVNGVLAKIVNG